MTLNLICLFVNAIIIIIRENIPASHNLLFEAKAISTRMCKLLVKHLEQVCNAYLPT